MFLFFSIMYFGRIMLDGPINQVDLGTPWKDYLMQMFGIALIPSIGFMIAMKARMARIAYIGFLSASVCSLLVCMFLYRDLIGLNYRVALSMNMNYQRDELINPLVFSYTGVTVLLLSFHLMINNNRSKAKLITALIFMFAGSAGMLFGGSRGAFISGILTIAITIVVRRYSAIHRIGIIFATIIILVIITLMTGYMVGFDAINRIDFTGLSSLNPSAGSGRMGIWMNGLHQFAHSPLIGSGLEEASARYVVHNVYLEAFMATGIIGGSMFLVMMTMAFRNAIVIIYKYPLLAWIGMIFIQKALNGLMSLRLSDPIIWFTMLLLLAYPVNNPAAMHSLMGFIRNPRTGYGPTPHLGGNRPFEN